MYIRAGLNRRGAPNESVLTVFSMLSYWSSKQHGGLHLYLTMMRSISLISVNVHGKSLVA